jgi:hypothetical protein
VRRRIAQLPHRPRGWVTLVQVHCDRRPRRAVAGQDLFERSSGASTRELIGIQATLLAARIDEATYLAVSSQRGAVLGEYEQPDASVSLAIRAPLHCREQVEAAHLTKPTAGCQTCTLTLRKATGMEVTRDRVPPLTSGTSAGTERRA